jgi:peptidoglycan/LPS O-acetylase OafA/YrhL
MIASNESVAAPTKPARLDALTGLRCFAALNIVFFHFSNPDWFDFRGVFHLPWLSAYPVTLRLNFAPVVNAGYLSVSFFIMLSGFVLAYNYAGRARAGKLDKVRFWEARWTRLYPVYLLSLLLGWQMISVEYGAHRHWMFWLGMGLTPLLMQGWVPEIATFWNTPAWTMSAEAFYYVIFPWVAAWKKPLRGRLLARMALVWGVAMIPGALYVHFSPDGIAHPDRFSWGPWLQVLKFTPMPHLPSFLFGVLLANLDETIPRAGRLRVLVGLAGFAGVYGILMLGQRVPYALIHDGLLIPLFGSIVLGLAGTNLLARLFSFRVMVFVGESSYCLYLLHFNLWNMLHASGVLVALHLMRFDPWISYAILVGLGLVALHLVEKPAQKVLRSWMGVWR